MALIQLAQPFFTARRAKGSLVVGGIDILKGLASQNIIQFTYTDNTSDKADDLSIEIADPNRVWMQVYLPKKGIECTASVNIINWTGPGDDRPLECGIFWIDNIDYKGPPNTVNIKATSIPVQVGIKNQKKHKSWEASDLRGIASQIANENQLELFYDTKQNPKVKRTDQVDKTDLEYLRDRAKEASLSVKIHKKQLVIYSEEEYEARPAVFELTYGASHIIEWSFVSKLDDTYKSAKNAYVNPETGKLTESEFKPEEPPESGSDLLLNERNEEEPDDPDSDTGGGFSVGLLTTEELIDYKNDDPASNSGKGKGAKDASTRKCKAKLREKNKKEKESEITVNGNLSFLSGLNVQITGYGIFDGKWFISSSTHEISSSGYTTKLKLRQALKGY